MLAIARSLMSRPKLILLDEPSSGLAPRVVTRVFEFVHQIKSQGYAILMVEQNVRKGLQLSDRAYLMESGRVHQRRNPEDFSGGFLHQKGIYRIVIHDSTCFSTPSSTGSFSAGFWPSWPSG